MEAVQLQARRCPSDHQLQLHRFLKVATWLPAEALEMFEEYLDDLVAAGNPIRMPDSDDTVRVETMQIALQEVRRLLEERWASKRSIVG